MCVSGVSGGLRLSKEDYCTKDNNSSTLLEIYLDSIKTTDFQY